MIKPFKIYLVGGAVRDKRLGYKAYDKDFVVIGGSVAEMLVEGYQQIGKDFPVFIDPKTHHTYALARTERKSGKGYRGFKAFFDKRVSLEEDLLRRDLTINAMAETAEGALIDPYNGLEDLNNKVLRHVSPAFVEDPVRLLRVARFSARYPDFSIAQETRALLRNMVEENEINHLVPDRVWAEIAKGLMEIKPSRMFEVLQECGALKILLPEVDSLWEVPPSIKVHSETGGGTHIMRGLDYSARRKFSLPVIFSVLCHDLGNETASIEGFSQDIERKIKGLDYLKQIFKRYPIPSECQKLAKLVIQFHRKLYQVPEMRLDTLLDFLMELDAVRQPNRLQKFLNACEANAFGGKEFENYLFKEGDLLQKALVAIQEVDCGEIVKQKKYDSNDTLKAEIYSARLQKLKTWFPKESTDQTVT